MSSIPKIELFRQVKSSITKNRDCLLVGIDVSKKSSVACFYNLEREILLKKHVVEHTRDGLEDFNCKIEQMTAMHNLQDSIIGVEPTANYHKPLCEFLKSKGHMVVYVSSVAAKSNRKTLQGGRWGKNDPKDAYNVVDLMRQGKILFYREENTPSADIHKYLLLRQRLIKTRSALKTRIQNNIWACHFPEACTVLPKTEDPDVLLLLENCPSSCQVKSLDYNSYMRIFPALRPGSKRFLRLDKVWHAAQTSIGFPLPSATALEARMIARDIQRTQKDIEVIDKILAEYCSQNDVFRQLFSIPGYGVFTVSVFKSVLGNINDFCHPRQILKFAGLDIESMSSGTYEGKEKISKKGNSLLRFAICQAATIAIAKNKAIRQMFEEKLKQRGNSKEAKAKLRIKFADKFIRAAFVMLKNDVPFNMNLFTVPVDDPDSSYVRAS